MAFLIWGIKVKLHFLFLLVVTAGILSGFFAEVAAALLALAVHEASHIFTARMLGIAVDELELLPFGGRMKLKYFYYSTCEEEIMIILAGPMGNLAFAALFISMIFQNIIPRETGYLFIKYHLALGLFNLLPALPLDGGRIFMLWLSQMVSFISAVRIAARAGKALALFLLSLFVATAFEARYNLSFLVAGIFLFLSAAGEEKHASILFISHIARKKENLLKRGLLPMQALVALAGVPVKQILYRFNPQNFYLVYVVDNRWKLKKCLTETEIFDTIIDKGLDIKVEDLL
ncbi:site-2 protease family protein [Thermosediminibacter oceani]|uniref:Peptidase M50 n=1 Tax=Thermosediminibacter oceani (strain ATCC BAA-1034 / DSM 16646 / JW/IW-1228P) TaxID=555079 RepID=D9S288_THEOJ|nr:site-2 protease family protein [Thermosediminibacter oceani]ADL07515.1 peptidase M50 [Thermosediminibacter oceani DSM 16646]